jgi:pimeloyl-ACP methyl ester carboxylesterase
VVARSLADLDSPAPRSLRRNAQPIVLLQGFAASSLVMLPLEEHLVRTLGRPVVRVRLGGAIAAQLGDIRASAERVAETLRRLARIPGFRYADVVGHSMGGLVATYTLKRLDPERRIRRVITLGTPHRGTPIALAGALVLGAFSRAIWQMLPGSSFLRELEALPVPSGSELIAVSAEADAVVPRTFARVAPDLRHRNATLAEVDHLGFLHHPDSHAFVGTALASADSLSLVANPRRAAARGRTPVESRRDFARRIERRRASAREP